MNSDEQPEVPPLDDGQLIERINKADLKPLFDANHKHRYVLDSEETDDYKAYKCTLCEMGYLVAKA